jgi:hypothetical protein
METTITAIPSCRVCGTEAFTIRVNPDKARLVCISCGAVSEIATAPEDRRPLVSRAVRWLSSLIRGSGPGTVTEGEDTGQLPDVDEIFEFLTAVVAAKFEAPEDPPTSVSGCFDLWRSHEEGRTGQSFVVCSFAMRSD